MRILHITPSIARSHGGISTAIRGLVKAQHESSHEVAVYTGYGPDDAREFPATFHRLIERDGMTVQQFPLDPNLLGRRLESCTRLAAAIRKDASAYDIVHIHSMWNWCVHQACRACRKVGKRYVISPHGGLDPWVMQKRPLVRKIYLALFERPNLEKAAAVHFTTMKELELTRPLSLSLYPAVVPLGVEEAFFAPPIAKHIARQHFDLPPDEAVFLQLGRVAPQKAIELLLEAWAAISCKDGGLLWIIGPGETSYVARLKGKARDLGIEKSVLFSDPVYGSDRFAALCAADALTLCSYRENFGLSAAEAMAAGLPVVVSQHVNLATDIEAARCGLVCALEPWGLAISLDHLMAAGKEGRARMGAAGREWALVHYRWQKIASQFDALYLKAQSGHKNFSFRT